MSRLVVRGLSVVIEHGGDPDNFVVLYRAVSPEDARETAGILRENLDRYAEENGGQAALEAAAVECDRCAETLHRSAAAMLAAGDAHNSAVRCGQAEVAEKLAVTIREMRVGPTGQPASTDASSEPP